MNKYFLVSCLFCFVLLSCKKQDDTIDLGLEYYPIDTGSSYIYQVQLITYSITGTVDTMNYQLKEYYHGTIQSSDELLYRIERYTRTSDTAQWPAQPDSGVWTVALNNNMAIRTENNQPYIKMEFPVQANKQWNGNLFNTGGADSYVMYPVNYPYILADTTYPNTLTITQSNEQSLIDKDYQIEVYAKGTGLVYKYDEVVEYEQNDTIEIGEYIINTGTIYKKTLISYVP